MMTKPNDSTCVSVGATTKAVSQNSVKHVEISKHYPEAIETTSDIISVEEPLEIRLGWSNDQNVFKQIAVTMRTPGDDRELAAGFLFTEGIVSSSSEITDIIIDPKCNVVNVVLNEDVKVDQSLFARHSFVASSCGVCGKKTIDAVRIKRQFKCAHETPIISCELINALPAALRAHQSHFEQTGGIHASCIFDLNGKLTRIMEDVGRHNALDKVLGAELLERCIPLSDKILMVSGRASFELVQKAAHAGLPILAAVGAPSSLAVELAEECDMTLLGFVRDERFNVYSGRHRIK